MSAKWESRWEEEPDCSGRWWFCGRMTEGHDPILDVALIGYDQSGDTTVTIEGMLSSFGEYEWLGAWLFIDEPDPPPPPIGDKETWEHMGYGDT